jgi:glycosyltransferase involved in cell wall biosynthesis/GT2 family glycosyltransferase
VSSKSKSLFFKKQSKVCNVVLSICRESTYLKDCINSILSNSQLSLLYLYIIDNCGSKFTHTFLEQVASNYSQVYFHCSYKNLNIIQSDNFGISLGNSPYVVLINSDVIVTPNWLSRLLHCAELDSRIAAVTPVTNHASNINFPIAQGANFYGMDRVLAQHSPCNYPDIVTDFGFCTLLRRSALEDVGWFDEIYNCSYYAYLDLCMRLTAKGYRIVVADNVYVYHQKLTSSQQKRNVNDQKDKQIFDARWSKEYQRQLSIFLKADPLKPARDLFQPPQQQWNPIQSMRETYYAMRQHWHQRQWFSVAKAAVKSLRKLPTAKREIVTPEFVAKVTRPGRLRVTYVLPGLGVGGGISSVVQLVNELIVLGVEARIVSPSFHPEVYGWKFFTQPIIFRSLPELLNNFPETDIAVATYWTTASWVAELVKAGRAKVGAYFIQDYESWFYPESDQSTRQEVKATYDLIPHKIVKSNWLAELLAQDGYETKKISLGMDLSVFYPRDVNQPNHPTIVAMARPNTPRRGFSYVIEALRLIKEAIPEAEVILFGDRNLKARKIPFEFSNEGIVSDQDRLAELYSSVDVFLDGSDFQGFGRPALEAMACGAACVLTNVGGVSEYAVDRENCLLVPPQQPEAFARTIIEILTNESLKHSLVEGGFKTVKNYCHKKEARKTFGYFNNILTGQRSGYLDRTYR